MKVLSLMASPRKRGNTAILLQHYIKGLVEGGLDVEVEEVLLKDKHIEICRGCRGCKSGKVDYCVINDDMNELYHKLSCSDILIYATPIYWYSMTSYLKIFIDRLYATKMKDWNGKKIVLLMTYGDTDEITSGAKNFVSIIEDFSKVSGVEIVLKYGVSTKGEDSFIVNNEAIQRDIYEKGIETLSKM